MPAERLDGAGEYGKLCYRRACQKPDAVYFNVETKQHYCLRCATLMNLASAMRGGERVCIPADDVPYVHPEADEVSADAMAADRQESDASE